jgi:uncharacterized protein (TIGR04255 family)
MSFNLNNLIQQGGTNSKGVKNSIIEAVSGFLLVITKELVYNPDDIAKQLSDALSKEIKYNPTNSAKINFTPDKGLIETNFNPSGYQFHFTKNGKKIFLIRCEKVDQSRFLVSLNLFSYEDWDSFMQEYKIIFNIFLNYFGESTVQSVLLNYVDSFRYTAHFNIQFNKIFNNKSTLIPQKLISSTQSVALNIVFDSESQIRTFKLKQENLIINWVSQNKSLTISHNMALSPRTHITLKECLRSRELQEGLDELHGHNKIMLKDLLAQELVSKIGL